MKSTKKNSRLEMTLKVIIFLSLVFSKLVLAQSCPDISGAWVVSEEAETTLVLDGESDTFSSSGTGSVTLVQSGCDISYNQLVTGLDGSSQTVARTGKIVGNQLEVSGKALIDFEDGACENNQVAGSGVIQNDRIELSVTADVTCADEDGSFTVIVSSIATFTGNSINVTDKNSSEAENNFGLGTLSQKAISTDGKSYDITSAMLLDVYDDSSRAVNKSEARISDYLDLYATFDNDSSQDGKFADFFVALRINNSFFMLDESGNMIPWNGSLKKLIPYESNVLLENYHSMIVNFDKFQTTGNYRFFTGYKIQGENVFHVTPKPTSINLAASSNSNTNSDQNSDQEGAFAEDSDDLFEYPEVTGFSLSLLESFNVLTDFENYKLDFYLGADLNTYSVVSNSGFDYIDIYNLGDPQNILVSRDERSCSPANALSPYFDQFSKIYAFRGLDYFVPKEKDQPGYKVTLQIGDPETFDDYSKTAYATLYHDKEESLCNEDGYNDSLFYYGYEWGAASFPESQHFESELSLSYVGRLFDVDGDEDEDEEDVLFGRSACSECLNDKIYQRGIYFVNGPFSYQGAENWQHAFRIFEYDSEKYGSARLVGEISDDNQPHIEYPIIPNDSQVNLGFNLDGDFSRRWYVPDYKNTPKLTNPAILVTDNVVHYIDFKNMSEPYIFAQLRLSDNPLESINDVIFSTNIAIGPAAIKTPVFIVTTNVATYILPYPGAGASADKFSLFEPIQVIEQRGEYLSIDRDLLYISSGDNMYIYKHYDTVDEYAISKGIGSPFYLHKEGNFFDLIDGKRIIRNGLLYDQTRKGFNIYEIEL